MSDAIIVAASPIRNEKSIKFMSIETLSNVIAVDNCNAIPKGIIAAEIAQLCDKVVKA